jgi:hypothetical protein
MTTLREWICRLWGVILQSEFKPGSHDANLRFRGIPDK